MRGAVGGGVGFRVDKEPNIIMNWTIGGEERGEDNNIHIPNVPELYGFIDNCHLRIG